MLKAIFRVVLLGAGLAAFGADGALAQVTGCDQPVAAPKLDGSAYIQIARDAAPLPIVASSKGTLQRADNPCLQRWRRAELTLRGKRRNGEETEYRVVALPGTRRYVVATRSAQGVVSAQGVINELITLVYVEEDGASPRAVEFNSGAIEPGEVRLDRMKLGMVGSQMRPIESRLVRSNTGFKLVVIVCADVCDERALTRIVALEAGGPPASVPIGAGGSGTGVPIAAAPDPSPAPASTAATAQRSEQKKAVDRKTSAVAKANPKQDLSRSVSPQIAIPKSPAPVGHLVPRFTKREDATPITLDGYFAKAVWGDCHNRDDFGPSEPATRMPVFGTRSPQGARERLPLCLVFQKHRSNPATEECIQIADGQVPPIDPRAPATLWNSGGAVACPNQPAPWTVKFITEDGMPLSREMMSALIDPAQTSIASVPLGGNPGQYTAPLRLDAIEKLGAEGGDAVRIDPALFNRKNVVLQRDLRIIEVTLESKVVALDGLTLRVTREGGEPADDCQLHLDIPPVLQRGQGWSRIVGSREQGARFQFTHSGGPNYRLSGAPDLMRALFVELPGTASDQQRAIMLRNANDQNRKTCFITVDAIEDKDLRTPGKIIERSAGQPQPALIVVTATDPAHAVNGVRADQYDRALSRIGELVDQLQQRQTLALAKPFTFVAGVVANGTAASEIVAGNTADAPLTANSDRLYTAVQKARADASPSLGADKLAPIVAGVFQQRGIQPPSQPPASVIHYGEILKARGNFCNSGLGSAVQQWTWLPQERQLLKISFATREVIEDMAKVGNLERLSTDELVYRCVHNLQRRVEEYVVVVPAGFANEHNNRIVREQLTARAAAIFGLK